MPESVSADLEVGAVYGGNHLKAADVPDGKRFKLTVEDVSLEEMPARDNKPSRRKLVLAFAGASKTLVLNSTNASVMAGTLGPKPATWKGASLILERTTTPFGGQIVPALRIIKVAPAGVDVGKVEEPPKQQTFEATDDDVGFLN